MDGGERRNWSEVSAQNSIREPVVELDASDIGRKFVTDDAGRGNASTRASRGHDVRVTMLVHCMKEFAAHGPIRPTGQLDARSNHSTPDVSAAVGSVSVGSASRLVRLRPGRAAGDVDQGVVNNQAGASAERAAYIRFGFDPESDPIDDRISEPAVSVHVRFDADQTTAE